MAKAAVKKKTPAKKAVVKKAKGKPRTAVEKIDPRKAVFLTGYCDPKSPTYGNAYASAIAAKYSESYAKSITVQMPGSISEILGNEKRIAKALAHVDEVLDLPLEHQVIGAFGPLYEKRVTYVTKQLKNGKKKKVKSIEKVPVMTINTTRIKEKTKVAELTLTSLKRDEWGKKEHDKGTTFVFNMGAVKARYTQPAAAEPAALDA